METENLPSESKPEAQKEGRVIVGELEAAVKLNSMGSRLCEGGP